MQMEGKDICFRLPASVSPVNKNKALSQVTQNSTETVVVNAAEATVGLQVIDPSKFDCPKLISSLRISCFFPTL